MTLLIPPPPSFPAIPQAPATPARSIQPGATGLAALQGTNFRFVDSSVKPRLILSIVGNEGDGKTWLANTCPKKRGMLFMSTDIGHEGVIEPAQAECRKRGVPYGHAQYHLSIPNGSSTKQIQDLAQAVWAQEAHDFEAAVRSGVSSIAIDTASELYHHLTLARFGKETEVPQMMWGIAGSEYSQLIRKIDETDMNLILLHKTKDKYQGKNKTGEKERRGYNETGFLVQCEVRMTRVIPGFPADPTVYALLPQAYDGRKHFVGTIVKCRHNTFAEGTLLLDPTFRDIANAVFFTMPAWRDGGAPDWVYDPATWD